MPSESKVGLNSITAKTCRVDVNAAIIVKRLYVASPCAGVESWDALLYAYIHDDDETDQCSVAPASKAHGHAPVTPRALISTNHSTPCSTVTACMTTNSTDQSPPQYPVGLPVSAVRWTDAPAASVCRKYETESTFRTILNWFVLIKPELEIDGAFNRAVNSLYHCSHLTGWIAARIRSNFIRSMHCRIIMIEITKQCSC